MVVSTCSHLLGLSSSRRWIQWSWGDFGTELVQALIEGGHRCGTEALALEKQRFREVGAVPAPTDELLSQSGSELGSKIYPRKKKEMKGRQLNLFLCFLTLWVFSFCAMTVVF